MKAIETIERVLIVAVRFLVLAICLLFWLIVGFLFWIPLLARTIALYCAGLIIAMSNKADVIHLQRLLETAIRFYAEGFHMILDSFQRQGVSSDVAVQPINWGKVVFESLWTGLFWSALFLIRYFSYIEYKVRNLFAALH